MILEMVKPMILNSDIDIIIGGGRNVGQVCDVVETWAVCVTKRAVCVTKTDNAKKVEKTDASSDGKAPSRISNFQL